jgi:Zn-dependent protease with chaperone function
MATLSADYYDGKRARPHSVRLSLSPAGDALAVEGEGVDRIEPLARVWVSEPMGDAPRLVKFSDGAHCEVRDHAALAVLLEAGGHRDSWVVRLQSRWGWALAAAVIAVAAVASGYRWGLPAVSEWIAFKLPDKALAQMGESTLAFLDDRMLSPSTLPEARQQSLRDAFDGLDVPNGLGADHQIVFRNSRAIGANAFALPDGTIIVTDQMVSLAGHDEEIVAVLAHELGHLGRRHSLRMLIQGSIVGFVAAWYLGDVSNVVAGLPALLLQARYSRDHEREADEYAAALLKANGISPSRLADMLEKMEQSHAAEKSGKEGGASDPFGGYLDSHPATRERIQALEED